MAFHFTSIPTNNQCGRCNFQEIEPPNSFKFILFAILNNKAPLFFPRIHHKASLIAVVHCSTTFLLPPKRKNRSKTLLVHSGAAEQQTQESPSRTTLNSSLAVSGERCIFYEPHRSRKPKQTYRRRTWWEWGRASTRSKKRGGGINGGDPHAGVSVGSQLRLRRTASTKCLFVLGRPPAFDLA